MKQSMNERRIARALVMGIGLVGGVGGSAYGQMSCVAPEFLGQYDTPSQSYGVELVGNIAYVGDWDAGMQIIDVTDPMAPAFLGSYTAPAHTWEVSVVGSVAYLAAREDGIHVVDVSDPASPSFLSSYSPPGWVYGIQVVGTTAYAACLTEGLQIIDVTDTGASALIGSYDTPGNAIDVFVLNGRAYVVDGVAGLMVFDVSASVMPNPVLLGTYATPDSAKDVQVHALGSTLTAYVADAFGGGLQIIDVSNPADMFLLGWHDTPGEAQSVDVDTGSMLAYVADATGGLSIVDVSDPAAPVLVGLHDTYPNTYYGVVYRAGKAYMAATLAGLVILDVDVACPCPADLTDDGVLDFFDISALLTAMGNGDLVADFNNDGVLDFFDISAFLVAFGAGCP